MTCSLRSLSPCPLHQQVSGLSLLSLKSPRAKNSLFSHGYTLTLFIVLLFTKNLSQFAFTFLLSLETFSTLPGCSHIFLMTPEGFSSPSLQLSGRNYVDLCSHFSYLLLPKLIPSLFCS